MPVSCATGDDERLRQYFAAVNREFEWAVAEIHIFHRAAKFYYGPKPFGLLLHADHQVSAINAFWKTRVVFNNASGGEQPSRHRTSENDRSKLCACSVQGGGEACATGTDDRNFLNVNRHGADTLRSGPDEGKWKLAPYIYKITWLEKLPRYLAPSPQYFLLS